MRVAFFNFSYLFIIYISMTNVLMNIIWLVPFYACGYSRNSASTVACWISMRTNHFYSWVDDLPLFIHLRIITKWKGYGVTLKDDFFWLSNLSLNMRGLVACFCHWFKVHGELKWGCQYNWQPSLIKEVSTILRNMRLPPFTANVPDKSNSNLALIKLQLMFLISNCFERDLSLILSICNIT